MDIGLNSAYTGLIAAKTGLYTVSHNIDNTKTPGYSRQRVYQRAHNAHLIYQDGFLGTGTDIYDIQRIRDEYTDFKFRNETSSLNEWEVKNKNLDEVQKTLGEPSDSSFRTYLQDFYQSIDNLTKNPGDFSFRQPVIENAVAMSKYFNETYSRFIAQEEEVLKEMENVVLKVNQLGRDIANLNKQIFQMEIDGKMANDLRDRRDLVLDELSQYATLTIQELDVKDLKDIPKSQRYDRKVFKHLDVSIGGISLVNHDYFNEIKLLKTDIDPVIPSNIIYQQEQDNLGKPLKDQIAPGAILDGHNAFKLEWSNSGNVELNGGRLKGLLDLYNGNGEYNSFRGIRFYKMKLDEFSYGFTTKFNEVHREGYTLGLLDELGHTDQNFFADLSDRSAEKTKLETERDALITAHGSATPEEQKKILKEIQAKNAQIKAIDDGVAPVQSSLKMAVLDEVQTDPKLIAAAGGELADPENNIILRKLLSDESGGREDKKFFTKGVSQGKPEDFIASVISFVGVDKQQAQRFNNTQALLTKNLEQRRLSVSGVELNEEMGDMVKFNHVYAAAARMISTIDEVLDITVNRLGMAGR